MSTIESRRARIVPRGNGQYAIEGTAAEIEAALSPLHNSGARVEAGELRPTGVPGVYLTNVRIVPAGGTATAAAPRRRRAPWWVWALAAVVGVLACSGAAYAVALAVGAAVQWIAANLLLAVGIGAAGLWLLGGGNIGRGCEVLVRVRHRH